MNGSLQSSFANSTDMVGLSAYNLRIGNDDRDENYYFNGLIDDFVMLNQSLSQEEIQAHYNNRTALLLF